jgi:hypothetical protein
MGQIRVRLGTLYVAYRIHNGNRDEGEVRWLVVAFPGAIAADTAPLHPHSERFDVTAHC